MIDWVSIVRHSRRRFSNYVGTRAPIRMKKRRRTPTSVSPISSHEDHFQYSCCCTHVSFIHCLSISFILYIDQLKVSGFVRVERNQKCSTLSIRSHLPKITTIRAEFCKDLLSFHRKQSILLHQRYGVQALVPLATYIEMSYHNGKPNMPQNDG